MFENVVYKVAATLTRPQYVKTSLRYSLQCDLRVLDGWSRMATGTADEANDRPESAQHVVS